MSLYKGTQKISPIIGYGANADLSNLTATGENHFTKPDLSNISEDGKYVLDGQWVPKFTNFSTVSTVNSYTHDLSSYLPNDNQAYEIFVYLDGVYGSQNADFAVGTVPNPVTHHFVGGGNIQLYSRVTVYSKTGCIAGILPVGVGTNAKRTIYSQISGTDLNSSHIYVYGYRRIGTNS